MHDEVERLTLQVRADTGGFARDVADMKAQLDGPLQAGADKAGRAIETTLLRAVRTGQLGFDDLRKTALSVLDSIAAAALKSGLDAILGRGGSSPGGGIQRGLASVLGGLLGGFPGRATGGPVSPARPYLVGERGPELFVPTASGRIEQAAGSVRTVNVAIRVQADAGSAPAALARSSRQVARAVRAALAAGV